jgi:hypothetical protein
MYYVYKITFEEVPHFYIGIRKCPPLIAPQEDKYLGSPCTHRSYWKIYTPKKHIMHCYESQEEAYQVEHTLIIQNWKNKYSLNRGVAGAVHEEILSNNGKRVAQLWHNRVEEDHKLREWATENARKCLSGYHERRQENEEENERFLSQCSENGKRTGASNIGKYNERKDELEYIRVRKENGRNRKGMIWINNGSENKVVWPHMMEEYSTRGYKRGRKHA